MAEINIILVVNVRKFGMKQAGSLSKGNCFEASWNFEYN